MTRQWEDPEFRAKASENMTRLHADPAFAARHAARSSKRMTRLNADPNFRVKVVEAARQTGSETMTRLNADPEFKAANSERTKQRWAEYRALKAQLTAQAANGNGNASLSVANLPRYGRPRGAKRAMTLTPDK
jgi:hypothetical protein